MYANFLLCCGTKQHDIIVQKSFRQPKQKQGLFFVFVPFGNLYVSQRQHLQKQSTTSDQKEGSKLKCGSSGNTLIVHFDPKMNIDFQVHLCQSSNVELYTQRR